MAQPFSRPASALLLLLLLLLFLALSSCSSPVGGLVLNLRTDLRGGVDVSTARVELFDSVPSATDETPDTRREVAVPRKAVDELRLGEWMPIREGEHYARIQLLGSRGEVVLSRLAAITVRGTTFVTIVMTRDCRDVMCPDPGGDPALSACLAGRCVDARCTVQTPEHCPDPGCEDAADCTPDVACADVLCAGGVCLDTPLDELCDAGEVCDPDLGCTGESACRDPRVGTPCDGADADACEDGAWMCVDDAVVCGDMTSDAVEVCNGLDDDCDGAVDEGATCPCPRVVLDDTHVYLVCTASPTHWTAARDACQAVGYTLATVDDAAQNGFLAGHISSNAWLGLNDMAEESVWRWTGDGSLLGAYAPWASGQPDSGSDPEDCATLQPDRLWYDRVCAQSHQYVCKAPER